MPSSLPIPGTILRALEREAERLGSTPEAVMVDILLRLVEPGERPTALLEAAQASLDHAAELMAERRLGDAFRRVWVAVLLALKAYSYMRGNDIPNSLGDFWKLTSEASMELETVLDAWYAGLAAFIADQEGIEDTRHLEKMHERARRLVEELTSAKS